MVGRAEVVDVVVGFIMEDVIVEVVVAVLWVTKVYLLSLVPNIYK